MMHEKKFSEEELEFWLKKSRDFGFLSPKSIKEQINHSLDFIKLCPEIKGRVLDLGAGGGLPSLALLFMLDNIKVSALDSMRKRCDFLENIKQETPSISGRFDVINGRAEEIGREPLYKEKFDFIVARGFGPPSYTSECACNFLKANGMLIVSGRPEEEAKRWNKDGLLKIGMELLEVREGNFSHAVIIRKVFPSPSKYPRKSALIKKSPLW